MSSGYNNSEYTHVGCIGPLNAARFVAAGVSKMDGFSVLNASQKQQVAKTVAERAGVSTASASSKATASASSKATASASSKATASASSEAAASASSEASSRRGDRDGQNERRRHGDDRNRDDSLARSYHRDESRSEMGASERGASERGASEKTPPAASITFRDHSRDALAGAALSPPASLKRAASGEVAKDSKRSRDFDSEDARVVAEKEAERAEARNKELAAENNALREQLASAKIEASRAVQDAAVDASRAVQAERDAGAARKEQRQAEQAKQAIKAQLENVTTVARLFSLGLDPFCDSGVLSEADMNRAKDSEGGMTAIVNNADNIGK
ncbi:hypothetical protein TeGR_g13951, partial [Tetraparma gracilis]